MDSDNSSVAPRSYQTDHIPWVPKVPFMKNRLSPGAIIEYEGLYYMYVMAGMAGDEERIFKKNDRCGYESRPKAVEGAS